MRKSNKKHEPFVIPYELDEYSLGSWLKKNAGTIGQVAGFGLGAALAPFTGGTSLLAAGTIGSQLGGQVGGAVQQNAMQGEANEQQQQMMQQQAAMQNNMQLTNTLQKNQFQNTPTFMCGGNLKKYPGGGTIEATQAPYYSNFQESLKQNEQTLKDKAELYYYTQQFKGPLRNKNPKVYDELTSKYGWNQANPMTTTTRVKGADEYAKANESFYLAPEEQQKVLGENWGRYSELRGKYGKDYNLLGEGDDPTKPETWKVGARHAVAFNPVTYKKIYEPQQGADNALQGSTGTFDYNISYDPASPEKYKSDLKYTEQPIQQMATRANGGIINYSGQDHSGMDGGIPVDAQGNPSVVSKNRPVALTENKEVTWLTPEGDSYVFSDKLGYSEKANKLISKYKKRLGGKLDGIDELAWKGLHRDLGKLSGEQETERETRVNKLTNKIDKYKKEMGSYITKSTGGALMEYTNGGPFDPYGVATGAQYAAEAAPYNYRPQTLSGEIPTQRATVDPSKMMQQQTQPQVSSPEQLTQFTGNVSPLGAIGSIVGNAILAGGSKPAQVNLPRTQAEQIDLSQQRATAKENYINARASMMNKLRSAGLSPAQYTQAVMAGTADLNTIANQTIGQSIENQANTNAGLRGQASQQNAQLASQEAMANAQAQQENDYMKQQYMANILQAPLNYLGERQRAAQMYDTANTEGKVVMYNDPKNTLAQKLLGLKKYKIKARQ